MVYDVTIIGGGPSGLSLAVMLARTGQRVLLLEREPMLGGTWRVEWLKGKYYSEHSPHVMSTGYNYFKALCNFLNVPFRTKQTYRSMFDIYAGKNLTRQFTFCDIMAFCYGYVSSRLYESNSTVKEFTSNFSSTGKQAMYTLSVMLATTPDKVLIQDIFDAINTNELIQLQNPEEWIQIAERYLSTFENVEIRKEYTVYSLNRRKDKYILNNDIVSHRCCICTDPNGLIKVLENASQEIQNNWRPWDELKFWAQESHYISIGFQLHFDKYTEFPSTWCWSCIGDWMIIILPMSKYIDTFTKDESIKSVWSCTIVDQDKYSNRLQKYVYECSKDEIQEEVLFQLKVEPTIFTFSSGVKKLNGRWTSKDVGFQGQSHGVLKSTGKLPNLHLVGTMTEKEIIVMNSGLQSSYKFVKELYPGYEKILETPQTNLKFRTFLIILILIIVIYKWKKRG